MRERSSHHKVNMLITSLVNKLIPHSASAASFTPGEVVANTSSALFLYDPEGPERVNGVSCRALPHVYDIREKDGRIVTNLKNI